MERERGRKDGGGGQATCRERMREEGRIGRECPQKSSQIQIIM